MINEIQTIQHQGYCATLFSDNETESLYTKFMHDDSVEAYQHCPGMLDFYRMATDWIKTGKLPEVAR